MSQRLDEGGGGAPHFTQTSGESSDTSPTATSSMLIMLLAAFAVRVSTVSVGMKRPPRLAFSSSLTNVVICSRVNEALSRVLPFALSRWMLTWRLLSSDSTLRLYPGLSRAPRFRVDFSIPR